jgi:cytochrome c oxidase assembly protein subunit 15
MIGGLIVLAAFVITLGTIVTGSGPHAGDIQAKRYHISPRTISWLHADAVIALIALTFGLYLIIRVSESVDNRRYIGGKVLLFIFICLGQGLIGYIQYFTKLPEALVAAHLLGATLVWLAIWNVGFTANVLTSSSKNNTHK